MFFFFILEYQNYQYLLIIPFYISSTVLFIGLNSEHPFFTKNLRDSIFISVFFISESPSIWGDFIIRPMQCVEK